METKRPKKNSLIRVLVKMLCVLTIAAGYLYINVTIDPAGILHAASPEDKEMTAVRIVESGSNASGLDDYNERLVKRTLVLRQGPFEMLVLGSSRAAMITSEAVGSNDMFNLAVAGGTLQDIIGVYGVYWSEFGAPERVLISCDPWLFNDLFPNDRYLAAFGDGYYTYLTERLGMEGLNEEDYRIAGYYADPDVGLRLSDLTEDEWKEVLSVPYFQSAVRTLFSENRSIGEVSPTHLSEGEFGILRTDGSYSYPQAYREAGDERIISLAQSQAPDSMGNGVFYTCYGNNYKLLGLFLDSLIEDGVEIQLVMTPFNPIVYNMIETHTPDSGTLKAADLLRTMADERNIPIVGDFDPDLVGAVFTDFYDGYHYSAENTIALVAQLGEEAAE